MKNVFAASALAVALLAGSAASSYAATENSSTSIASNITDFGSSTFGNTIKAGTTFTDFFTFVLPANVVASAASVTASLAIPKYIKNFTLALFKGDVSSSNGVYSGNGTQIISKSTSTGDVNDPTHESVAWSTAALAQGDYYLKVTGVTQSTPKSVSYGGSLSITTVPLPSTVALFGVALAGLGVAGAVRRKSASSAA